MTVAVAQLSELILPVLHHYRITKAGIFGSVARGDNNNSSDVDILVDAPRTLSLIDMISLQQELEATLHKSVDLVEYHLLKKYIKEQALKEEVRIL